MWLGCPENFSGGGVDRDSEARLDPDSPRSALLESRLSHWDHWRLSVTTALGTEAAFTTLEHREGCSLPTFLKGRFLVRRSAARPELRFRFLSLPFLAFPALRLALLDLQFCKLKARRGKPRSGLCSF